MTIQRPFLTLCCMLSLGAGVCADAEGGSNFDVRPVLEINLGQSIGQFRAVPVNLGAGAPKAVCALYGSDAEIDPYQKMFFFPKSTLKMVLFDETGRILWKRDLGPGVVPGIWFAPVFAFDIDRDGVDEIYHVNNTDPLHPLDYDACVLERLDAQTGKPTGQWKWTEPGAVLKSSHIYRRLIFAGMVRDQPVLVAANGTRGPMRLRAFNADMSIRWEALFDPAADGCSEGTHMCQIVDIDNDGADEVMWGERAIRLDDGVQLFAADAGRWNGHSDVVQPVLDRTKGIWWLWTCRETKINEAPRLVFFNNKGERVWSDIDHGHMDTGWAAHLKPGGEPTVYSIRIGGKERSREGESRTGVEEFAYGAFSGAKQTLDFQLYTTIPVDLDGDGYHELVRGYFEGDGVVTDGRGRVLARTGGLTALASKFTSHPGEQILTYRSDGTVLVYRDLLAVDRPEALARYRHRYYLPNQKLTGVGYNLFNLGGL